MATPEFDNLTKVFIARHDHIWKTYYEGKEDDAFVMAAELLMEPRLGTSHQAGMHQLMACGPVEPVKHAQEAVRLYREILREYHDGSTMHEKACMRTKLRLAKEHLEGVTEIKRKYDEDIARLIAQGYTLTDIQNAQLEQAEREYQAKQAAEQAAREDGAQDDAQDDGNPGAMLPPPRTTVADDASAVTAADTGTVLPSSQSAPDTASRTTKSSQDRSQSTAATETASSPHQNIHVSDEEEL